VVGRRIQFSRISNKLNIYIVLRGFSGFFARLRRTQNDKKMNADFRVFALLLAEVITMFAIDFDFNPESCQPRHTIS